MRSIGRYIFAALKEISMPSDSKRRLSYSTAQLPSRKRVKSDLPEAPIVVRKKKEVAAKEKAVKKTKTTDKTKKEKVQTKEPIDKKASTKAKESKKRTYTKKIKDDKSDTPDEAMEFSHELPSRNKAGELIFADWKDFKPNMTPKEVLQAGSFGGTYFRPIYSSITKENYSGVWKELPKDWLEGLDVKRQVSSSTYRNDVNTYKAKCGGSLEMWETSGWMHAQDPYGWFMWYCRFYQGRRTEDDERQVGRWLRCAGTKGRWKNNLISKCVRSGCAYDNFAVSPVVRQTLQHWGYKLTKEHFDAYAKKMKQ